MLSRLREELNKARAGPRHWATDKYIYLMLTVFPLFTGFWGYTRITLSKYVFLLIATGLWLAALFFFSALRRAPGMRLRPVHFAALAFFAVCALSALLSEQGLSAILGSGRYEGLLTTGVYVAIFIGVSGFGSPKRGYAYALGAGTALTCLVALIQLFGKNVFWLFPNGWCYYDAHTMYTSEFLGTIGNTNLLSGFLCLSLPLTAGVFITDKGMKSAVLLIPFGMGIFVLAAAKVSGGLVGLLGCALVGAPVVISGMKRLVRGIFVMSVSAASAALALAFSARYENGVTAVKLVFGKIPLAMLICASLAAIVGILLIMMGERHSPPAKKMRLMMCALSAGIVVCGLAFVYVYPFGEGGTLYELSRVLHGDIRDGFGSSRVLIWRNVLALVPEHPLLGGGPDSLAARLDLSFTRYVPETGQTLYTYVDNAHNEYLGYLVNVGVSGLAVYLALMGMTIAGWIRRRDWQGIGPALGCALVCYWIQGFFGLGLCIVAPLMWIAWGLMESGQPVFPLREIRKVEAADEEKE